MTFAEPRADAPPTHPLTLIGLLIGVTLAPLLAFNQTPSATLYNQLLAFAGFGVAMVGLAWSRALRPGWRLDGVSIALLLMLAVAATAPFLTGLPSSMALTSAAMLLGAWLVLQTARAIAPEQRDHLLTTLSLAMVAAGLLSVLVCFVQMYVPSLADGAIIARSGVAGRAVGNMRQPNHLASLLLWSCVAAVWLWESGWLERRLGTRGRATGALIVLLCLFVFCVLLSASRTGMFGVVLLAIWGAVDKRLSKPVRGALISTLVMYAASWAIAGWWAHSSNAAFGAEARLAEGAGSPSRVAIVLNAINLLQRYPWTGSGWGDFNLAWTMTPFPDRPVAFFDHTHNLVLQLLVEMGLPLGLLTVGLLTWGLWQALRAAHRSGSTGARCAVMLVLMIGLHSMTEYPLWYAYFLLPAAFAFGLALAYEPDRAIAGHPIHAGTATSATEPDRRSHPATTDPISHPPRPAIAVAGALMLALSALAVPDYLRIVHIYAPPLDAGPLDERIATGQRSPLFALQADYAAATVPAPGRESLDAARRTGHHLIDVRLMMAWAKSLHAVGETDKARYVVQRLKEFRNPASQEWLDQCAMLDNAGIADKPFQCEPPSRDYDFREFR